MKSTAKNMAHGMEHTTFGAPLLAYGIVDAWIVDSHQTSRRLFVVTGVSQVIGRMSVPEINTANLHIGKKVRVKLQKYPFKDWGMLEGRIYALQYSMRGYRGVD